MKFNYSTFMKWPRVVFADHNFSDDFVAYQGSFGHTYEGISEDPRTYKNVMLGNVTMPLRFQGQLRKPGPVVEGMRTTTYLFHAYKTHHQEEFDRLEVVKFGPVSGWN